MIGFVNFKLYNMLNLHYPPNVGWWMNNGCQKTKLLDATPSWINCINSLYHCCYPHTTVLPLLCWAKTLALVLFFLIYSLLVNIIMQAVLAIVKHQNWKMTLGVTFILKTFNIQLFQLTLSNQSIKLEDKTARLCGIFFWINSWKPAMLRLYSEDLWSRAIWMKEIPGYQVDEVAAVSRMASLGVRPYCRTRKHQWALFRSCVNWSVNLSSDEGDTNENITWKYKIILFVLL